MTQQLSAQVRHQRGVYSEPGTAIATMLTINPESNMRRSQSVHLELKDASNPAISEVFVSSPRTKLEKPFKPSISLQKNNQGDMTSEKELMETDMFFGEHYFDALLIPADLELAEAHSQATRFARPVTLLQKQSSDTVPSYLQSGDEDNNKNDGNQRDKNTRAQRCPCCAFQIDRMPISIKDNLHEFGHLGSGYPLFLNYVYWCGLIILFYIAVCGGFDIYTNLQGQFCVTRQKLQGEVCPPDILYRASLINIVDREDLTKLQNLIETIATLLMMMMLAFARKSQRQVDIDISTQIVTPGDYTIFVRNIKQELNDFDYRQELAKFFSHKIIPGRPTPVANVTLCYNNDELDELVEEKEDLIGEKQKYIEHHHHEKDYQQKLAYREIESSIKKCLQDIEELQKEVKQDQGKYFIGHAFVSFQRKMDRDAVLELHAKHSKMESILTTLSNNKHKGNDSDHLQFQGQTLLINAAPEPTDVNWEGVCFTPRHRLFGRLWSFLYMVLFSVFSFVVLLLMTWYQEYKIDQLTANSGVSADEESDLRSLLNFAISIAIAVLNAAASFLIPYLVKMEGHLSNTNELVSAGTQLAITYMLQSAVIDFLITALFSHRYLTSGGFVYTETIVCLQNMLITPLVQFVNPDYLLKKMQWNDLKERLIFGTAYETQEQVNEIMELPEYDLADRYAMILNTMWMTFLYAPLIPVVLFFAVAFLIAVYWIEKFTMTRRACIKNAVSVKVSIAMLELLEYIIIFYAIGSFVFEYQIMNMVDEHGLLQLAIGAVYNLLPMQKINEKIFPLKAHNFETINEETSLTWLQAYQQHIFEHVYEELAPIHVQARLARGTLKHMQDVEVFSSSSSSNEEEMDKQGSQHALSEK